MEIKERIQLDLAKPDMMLEIDAKQGDTARLVEVELTDHGVAVAIPEGASASFRCRKPDGHSCYNPASIASDHSHVLVELTDQVLAVPGRVMADVVLEGEDSGVLSAFCFCILVEPRPLGDLAESRDELLAYEEQLEEIKDTLAQVEEEIAGIAPGGTAGVTSIRVTNFSGAETPSITVAATLEDGSGELYIINLDANGYPVNIHVKDSSDPSGGYAVPIEWEGF